jgi:uncharacterized protein
MRRVAAPLAALAFALVAAVAGAQQAPAPLPKGVFPGAEPSAAPPTAPAQSAPTPAPTTRAEPAATDGPAGRDLARDPLGRVAVPPAAPVTDLAGVLGPAALQTLRSKLIEFERARGSQIAVIVVPTTQPEPIADFTNRVGDAWKIGRKGVGDGVLIAVAVQDRKVWISVARALEGAIPDVVASRITREFMGPSFAKGDFAGGINAGVDAVMKRIEGEALPTPAGIPRHKVDAGEDLMAAIVPLVIFGAIVAGLLRRAFGTPGAAVTSMGVGALAGVLLTSLVMGAIAAVAVFVFSGFFGGGGGGGRVLGGRRRGPVIIPGGWSGGGGWGGGSSGGGGWSSGGGGDFAGGGGGSSW